MPGSTTARGYGAAHQAERARWAPLVAQGIVACARCMQLIAPGIPWDLGHTDDRTTWTGPEHRRCNRRIGGIKGNQSSLRRRRSTTAPLDCTPGRLVIALFGPPGAGKTTIAHQSGLPVYDRDDLRWSSESGFRQRIRQLATDMDAQAVVIRTGATSTARARTINDVAATHAFLVLVDQRSCHYQAGHRRRHDTRSTQAAIDKWFAIFDHADGMPEWPGSWDAVWGMERVEARTRQRW